MEYNINNILFLIKMSSTTRFGECYYCDKTITSIKQKHVCKRCERDICSVCFYTSGTIDPKTMRCGTCGCIYPGDFKL